LQAAVCSCSTTEGQLNCRSSAATHKPSACCTDCHDEPRLHHIGICSAAAQQVASPLALADAPRAAICLSHKVLSTGCTLAIRYTPGSNLPWSSLRYVKAPTIRCHAGRLAWTLRWQTSTCLGVICSSSSSVFLSALYLQVQPIGWPVRRRLSSAEAKYWGPQTLCHTFIYTHFANPPIAEHLFVSL
jgi:hypothetical protein